MFERRVNRSLSAEPASVPWWGVIFYEPVAAGVRVAALSVLDRVLVALHRAGCGVITVVAPRGGLPRLPRARAWGISFGVVTETPVRSGYGWVMRGDTLVQAVDLEALRLGGGAARLATREGEPLPVGWVGSELGLGAGGEELETLLAGLPVRVARGVAGRVRTRADGARATTSLWGSITGGSDGWVDRWFNRPVGRPLSRLLVHTPVTPNVISVGASLMGLLAAGLFAVGRPEWAVAAALVFQVSAIVDCVDGDVARAVFKETAMGKWLDLVGDQVVHVGVFAGIAVGLARRWGEIWPLWLGLSAGMGAVLSFWVVLRRMREAERRGGGTGRMQRVLDAVTNRDFSVLVLGLAMVDRLEWFLWMAGLGSHAFWMGLWVLGGRGGTRREGVR